MQTQRIGKYAQCVEEESNSAERRRLLHNRPGPIILFKLPIILLNNAPKFSLLCPNYAPLCPITYVH